MMGVLKFFVLCLLPLTALTQGPQIITGPIDTLVQVGNEVTLNCVIANGGDGYISWQRGENVLYKGNIPNPGLYESDEFLSCCELSGDTASGDFSVKIKSAEFIDSDAWKCKYSGGGTILEDHGVLSVLGPLSCQVVDGAQNEGLYQVIEGQSKEVVCSTDGDNMVSWTKDGIAVESGNSPLTLETEFSEEDSEAVFDCQLQHETLPEPITCENTIAFDVQYKPILKIDVSAENKDGKVLEGNSFFADCMVLRAKPPIEGSGPTWSTTVPDAQLADGSSQLDLAAVQRNQAGEYVCSAENTFFDGTTGKSEETVTIDVQYPPVLTLDDTYTFKVGDEVSIDCSEKVTEANPAASDFRWIRFNSEYQTGPVLQIASITKDDKGMFGCEASNNYFDGTTGTAISNTELIVQYKPEVKALSPVALKVGESQDIVCTVDAEPAAESTQWFKSSDPTTPISDSNILSLTDVTLEDAGSYRCEATNTFYDGEQAKNDENNGMVEVFVQYMSSVTVSGPTAAVSEGDQRLVLNCTVESVPEPHSYMWEFVDKAGKKEVLSETSNSLDLGTASRTHAGNYTCTAKTVFYDGEEESGSASIDVSVKYKPDITNKDDSMVAVELGATAKLVCKAAAIPDPQFTWLNSTQGQIKNQDNKYTIEEKYEDGSFINTLTIMDVVQADYSTYECQAVNEIGSDSFTVELATVSAPEQPVDLSVIETTHHSLKVSWKPGYNGGAKQEFVVQIVNKKDPNEKRVSPVIYEDGSETYSHLFTGLDASAEYIITVTASNMKGESEPMEFSTKTDVKPATGAQNGSNSSTVIIVVVVVILILIIVIVIVVMFIIRRRRSSYNTQKGEQVPKQDEEVPLNDTKENEKGVSEFALDENEKTKGKDKDEESQPLKENEETADDDKKDDREPSHVNAPRPDEPPFMINGSSPEKEAPEETKIEDQPEPENTDKSPADEKGPKKQEDVVYAELDHGKRQEGKPAPHKEPTEYATIDFARTSQRPGQPTSL